MFHCSFFSIPLIIFGDRFFPRISFLSGDSGVVGKRATFVDSQEVGFFSSVTDQKNAFFREFFLPCIFIGAFFSSVAVTPVTLQLRKVSTSFFSSWKYKESHAFKEEKEIVVIRDAEIASERRKKERDPGMHSFVTSRSFSFSLLLSYFDIFSLIRSALLYPSLIQCIFVPSCVSPVLSFYTLHVSCIKNLQSFRSF